MNRAEMRKKEKGKSTVSGDLRREMVEIKKMSDAKINGIRTITADCSEIFTIVCC